MAKRTVFALRSSVRALSSSDLLLVDYARSDKMRLLYNIWYFEEGGWHMLKRRFEKETRHARFYRDFGQWIMSMGILALIIILLFLRSETALIISAIFTAIIGAFIGYTGQMMNTILGEFDTRIERLEEANAVALVRKREETPEQREDALNRSYESALTLIQEEKDKGNAQTMISAPSRATREFVTNKLRENNYRVSNFGNDNLIVSWG